MNAGEKNRNVLCKITFVGAVEFSTVEYMSPARKLFNMFL